MGRACTQDVLRRSLSASLSSRPSTFVACACACLSGLPQPAEACQGSALIAHATAAAVICILDPGCKGAGSSHVCLIHGRGCCQSQAPDPRPKAEGCCFLLVSIV